MIKFSWHTIPKRMTKLITVYQYAVDRFLPVSVDKKGFGRYIHFKQGVFVDDEDGGWQRYRPNMKGGHRHNHIKNAHERMRRCRICDNPITKYEGFKAPWYGHICLDCYFEECNEEAYMCGIPFGWKKSDNFYRSFIRRARKR